MTEGKKYVTWGVRVLIINPKNEVLLGRRSDHREQFYAAPGGHLEFGESFEQCAIRELYEELNIKIEEKEIKYLTTLNVVKKKENFHYLNIITSFFIDDIRSSKIENYDTEHCLGWEWIPWADFI